MSGGSLRSGRWGDEKAVYVILQKIKGISFVLMENCVRESQH